MKIDRKSFLKIAASGGLSAVMGMSGFWPSSWRETGGKLTMVERQSLVMGSVVSFKVIAPSKDDGYEAIRRGVQAFQEMDRIFSMYRSDSEMAKLSNHSGTLPIKLSDDALNLLRNATQFYKNSNGLFDVTIEPAMRRWGFRRDKETSVLPPNEDELKKLEKIIGADKLIIESDKALLTNTGMAIDMGGIAGGYALDKAIGLMKKCNIAAAFINFSGDIHCFGESEKGRGWPVKVFNPNTGQVLDKDIELKNEALSTSGAYQNRRNFGSKRSWGHLFLPLDARPAEPVSSLTAIHSSAMMADAWSTAAYLGSKPPKEVKTIVIK